MDITAIKAVLGYPKLELSVATTEDGVTPATTLAKDGVTKVQWLRHWDNTGRVAVSIAEDLYNDIKANPALDNLSIQVEEKTSGTGNDYTAKRIIRYTPATHEL